MSSLSFFSHQSSNISNNGPTTSFCTGCLLRGFVILVCFWLTVGVPANGVEKLSNGSLTMPYGMGAVYLLIALH